MLVFEFRAKDTLGFEGSAIYSSLEGLYTFLTGSRRLVL
jgi:hypothetical protein